VECPHEFSAGELRLLRTYGTWLEALANGELVPENREQRHFVKAASGIAAPQGAWERLWARYREKTFGVRASDAPIEHLGARQIQKRMAADEVSPASDRAALPIHDSPEPRSEFGSRPRTSPVPPGPAPPGLAQLEEEEPAPDWSGPVARTSKRPRKKRGRSG